MSPGEAWTRSIADQREAAFAVGGGALATVHRLVLELGAGQHARELRVRAVADVVHAQRVEAGGDEDGGGAQEAAGDAGLRRVRRELLDVARGDQRGVRQRGQPGTRLGDAVDVGVRGGGDHTDEEGHGERRERRPTVGRGC